MGGIRVRELAIPFRLPYAGGGSIPRLRHRRCSRQGKAYAANAASNRTLFGFDQEVSAHFATGACLQTGVPGTRFLRGGAEREGTVAICGVVVSRSIRVLHHSLLQISCLP